MENVSRMVLVAKLDILQNIFNPLLLVSNWFQLQSPSWGLQFCLVTLHFVVLGNSSQILQNINSILTSSLFTTFSNSFEALIPYNIF